MIKHLFKLIWNRKKSNFLLTVEVLLSFLVLFGVLTVFFFNYFFFTEPTGYDYKNLWQVNFNWNTEDNESVRENLKQIDLSLKSFNEITDYSFCSSYSYPYSGSMWMSGYKNSQGINVSTVFNQVDDNFKDVLNLQLIDGRWFDKSDDAAKIKPVIINQIFRDEYFGEGNPAVGENIISKDKDGEIKDEQHVIGVIDHYKYRGEFEQEYPLIIRRFNINKTEDLGNFNNLVIKVKPGTPIDFEEKLINHISALTKGWMIKISVVEDVRRDKIKEKAIELLIPGAIAFFLILNVALGLLGVLWYNINRRKSEIGLRRAAGASAFKISSQIMGEAIVLGTFSLLLGIILAIQVPILDLFEATAVVYTAGIVAAILFLYGIISICSLYPSWLASRVQPAEALHNE